MSNKLISQLKELVAAAVIDQATADKISTYYTQKPVEKNNRLNLVYGILGSLLVGLGIILVIAHNWDELPKTLKTFLAVFPLVLTALLCIYVMRKKSGETVWQECAAILYFFSVGAAMALIAQIYHHEGTYDSFVLNWMIFVLPLVLLMPSYISSLLTIAIITTYGFNLLNHSGGYHFPWWYWMVWLIMLGFTFYYRRQKGFSNAYVFLLWFLVISFTVRLSSFAHYYDEFMFITYACLFSLVMILGRSTEFAGKSIWQNPLLIIGTLGNLSILYTLSYDFFWENRLFRPVYTGEIFTSQEMLVTACLMLVAAYFYFKYKANQSFHPLVFTGVLLFIIFFLSFSVSWAGYLFCNLWLVITGLYYVIRGNRLNSLAWLNFGMLIIGILITMRFFDDHLPYLWRGLIMLLFGIGFFAVNYRLIKIKNRQTKQA
jgi:uncharacterized membrane protein